MRTRSNWGWVGLAAVAGAALGCGGVATQAPDQHARNPPATGGPASTGGSASTGAVGATPIGGSGGAPSPCIEVPHVYQHPLCSRDLLEPGEACDVEGLVCDAQVTGGSGVDLCHQPNVWKTVACCDHIWTLGEACPDVGAGGAAGGTGGSPETPAVCFDAGWGLSADGTLEETAPPGGTRVLSAMQQAQGAPVSAPTCQLFDWWHCHLGSRVMGTANASPTPTGRGGNISPGAYRLTSISADGGQDPDLLVGVGITQTLYLSATAALFESDDDHRFSFTGAYAYAAYGVSLLLSPTCESQPAQYRQWSLDLTYTATAKELTLFSKSLSYSAVYELVPE